MAQIIPLRRCVSCLCPIDRPGNDECVRCQGRREGEEMMPFNLTPKDNFHRTFYLDNVWGPTGGYTVPQKNRLTPDEVEQLMRGDRFKSPERDR